MSRKPRLVILLALLGTINAWSSEYIPGKNLCKDVAKHESGQWVEVPQSYKAPAEGTTEVYYWFLGGQFHPKKKTIAYVNGGPGATSHNYHRIFDELAKTYNVLFFDQRGYVCSRPAKGHINNRSSFYSIENSARDLDMIRQILNIDEWSVMGESFGATIGAKYASLFPDRTLNLTLLGPAFTIPEQKSYEEEYEKKLKKTISSLLTKEIINCGGKNIINDLGREIASAFGVSGLKEFSVELTSFYSAKAGKLPKNEISNFVGDFFRETYQRKNREQGEFSLRDDKYTWETQVDTEIIVNNDLYCSFLSNQEESVCAEGEDKNIQTFDISKLKLKTPVNIFIGEFDGTPVEQLADLGGNSPEISVCELKNRGHGNLFETFTENSTDTSQVLIESLANKPLDETSLKRLDVIKR